MIIASFLFGLEHRMIELSVSWVTLPAVLTLEPTGKSTSPMVVERMVLILCTL